jgi:hypothetical protein
LDLLHLHPLLYLMVSGSFQTCRDVYLKVLPPPSSRVHDLSSRDLRYSPVWTGTVKAESSRLLVGTPKLTYAMAAPATLERLRAPSRVSQAPGRPGTGFNSVSPRILPHHRHHHGTTSSSSKFSCVAVWV